MNDLISPPSPRSTTYTLSLNDELFDDRNQVQNDVFSIQQGKRNNRRRIRHRPRRARASCSYCAHLTTSSSIISSPQSLPPGLAIYNPTPSTSFTRSNNTTSPWNVNLAQSDDQRYSSLARDPSQISYNRLKRSSINSVSSMSSAGGSSRTVYFPRTAQEDSVSRDRRFFGGTVEDDDADGNADLRGAMLDVVLGLFDGMDYED